MNNQLTQDDIRKMEEEIEHRKLVVRKKAIEDVKEARAHGDLSENFEYHAAKKEKNKNESRIRYLERMIKTAQIIEVSKDAQTVDINCYVTVYFEEDEESEVYKIVTTVRGNSLKGRISIESPLGKAIYGHKIGERIYIQVNESYGYYITIKSVERKVENEEDDDLRSF